jgi:hypothetical protein
LEKRIEQINLQNQKNNLMENTIKSLAKSLVKAQSTIAGAIMDSNNPFFGSK